MVCLHRRIPHDLRQAADSGCQAIVRGARRMRLIRINAPRSARALQ